MPYFSICIPIDSNSFKRLTNFSEIILQYHSAVSDVVSRPLSSSFSRTWRRTAKQQQQKKQDAERNPAGQRLVTRPKHTKENECRAYIQTHLFPFLSWPWLASTASWCWLAQLASIHRHRIASCKSRPWAGDRQAVVQSCQWDYYDAASIIGAIAPSEKYSILFRNCTEFKWTTNAINFSQI